MRKKSKQHRDLKIPDVVLPDAKTMQFSFKHLDSGNQKFPLDGCPIQFWPAMLREIQQYSLISHDDFIYPDAQAHRHVVVWEETTEPNGFSHLNYDQDVYSVPWQFQVGIDYWRVIGFVIDPIFYVVWVDPNHVLYPRGPVTKPNLLLPIPSM